MTHRYPEDVNDPTGTNVETNNALLVDDEGNRVLPAVRVPQDSDPCCAEVINAPAKQLRDRLALLESKVPLLDEAAAVNGGDLNLSGGIVAPTAAVNEIACRAGKEVLVNDSLAVAGNIDIIGTSNSEWMTIQVTDTIVEVDDIGNLDGWDTQGDGLWRYWANFDDDICPSAAGVKIKADGVTHISDSNGIIFNEAGTELGYFNVAGGILQLYWNGEPFSGTIEFQAIGEDSTGGTLKASIIQSGTVKTGTLAAGDHPQINVQSNVNATGKAVTVGSLIVEGDATAESLSIDALQAKTSGGTIEVNSSIEANENITADGTVTAQKFVGPGVLKGLGFVGLFIASGGGTASINGSVYSSWNIQHVSNNTFSVSGVTQSCTAVLIKTGEASETEYESVLMANGISSVSVSSNGEFLLPMTDAKYLVFVV